VASSRNVRSIREAEKPGRELPQAVPLLEKSASESSQ
jgi:hypothetical protein